MPSIRFVDMWDGCADRFGELVGLIPGAEVTNGGCPDILVYSVFGGCNEYVLAGLRVAVNWENSSVYPTPPADLKFTSSFEDGCVWAPLLIDGTKHLRDTFYSMPREGTPKFASMLFCHCTELRMKFADRLLERCRDLGVLISGTNRFSNVTVPNGGAYGCNKLTWMCDNRCVFSICPENSFHPGYVTEKIRDAYMTRHIPVYWGCRECLDAYIPEGSYIWLDPENMDRTIDIMLNVWNDSSEQEEMLAKAPIGKLCERTAQEVMAEHILRTRTGGLLARLSCLMGISANAR